MIRFSYRGNLWLILLSALFFVLMLSLSYWQLGRGFDKQGQLRQLRSPPTSLTEQELDWLLEQPLGQVWFQPLRLTGRWLPRTLLLDNSIYKEMEVERRTPYCFLFADCGRPNGRSLPGYRVFTLFAPRNSHWVILVERGWLAKEERERFSADLGNQQTMLDALVIPKAGARRVLKKEEIRSTAAVQLVQSLRPEQIGAAFRYDVYPYPVFLSSLSSAALPQAAALANFSFLGPQRHWGYALQWLVMAIAIALLCFFASVRVERVRKG